MNKIVSCLGIKRLFDVRTISTRITAGGKEVPKRKHFENRITLIAEDNTVSITDLKIAQNLSLKRELKLVKIQDVDAKTRRPIYKLMTNAEYHSEELEKRKEKQSRQSGQPKSAKLLSLSWRIGEHDLLTSAKKMIKLLEKDHEVRVVITGDSEKELKDVERVYASIEKEVKSFGNILQKRLKGSHLKFQLMPLKTAKSQASSSGGNSDQNKNDDKGPI